MNTSLITTLHAEHERTWAEARALLDTASAAGRDLTPAEDEQYRALAEKVERIGARVTKLREDEDRAKASQDAFANLLGQPVDHQAGGVGLWLPSRRDYRELVESRAVSGSGNAFLPATNAATWYDRLRSRSVVLAAGPTVLGVENGSLRVPKITASVTVSTIAENAAITPSDPSFDKVTLTPRKIAALTLASNEALDDSQPGLREVIAGDLIKQTATVLDTQFLVGDASGSNMRGLVNVSGTTAGPSLGAAGGTPTLDNYADCVNSYEAAGGDLSRAVWFMAPRSWSTVRKLKDSQNRYQLNPTPTGAEERSLFGAPVRTTTHLPINLTVGASTDCSQVLLVDMSQVVIGKAKDVELAYSSDYAFNADQTAIRVVARFDIGVMNPEAVVVMSGVRG